MRKEVHEKFPPAKVSTAPLFRVWRCWCSSRAAIYIGLRIEAKVDGVSQSGRHVCLLDANIFCKVVLFCFFLHITNDP